MRSLLVIAILGAVSLGGLAAIILAPSSPPPKTPVRISLPLLEKNALIYIARENGYFADEGLEVVVTHRETGPQALEDLEEGTADFVGAAEFPVVRAILNDEPLAILASFNERKYNYVIAHPQSGIKGVEDLREKKIGYAKGTIGEFYIGRLLTLRGIELSEVTMVELASNDFVPALVEGRVDALSGMERFLFEARKEMPGVKAWPSNTGQSTYSVLVAEEDWVKANEKTAQALLRALIEAEAYAIRNPEEAKEIARLSMEGHPIYSDPVYIEISWPPQQHTISLDQALVVMMKDEARWLLSQSGSGTPAPNLQAHVHSAPLREVRPTSVNIIE